MFSEWLATKSGLNHKHFPYFLGMLKGIEKNPTSLEYVLDVVRRWTEEIESGYKDS